MKLKINHYRYIKPVRVFVRKIDLGDDHIFLAIKCPRCKELLQINEKQRIGYISVHHDTKDGGCGFHKFIKERLMQAVY